APPAPPPDDGATAPPARSSRTSRRRARGALRRFRWPSPARTTARPGAPGRAVVRAGGASAALVRDRGGGLRGRLRVEVAPALGDRDEVLVELVEQRDARRDVEPGDVLVGDAVEVLDERAQRVAVRGDEHGLAGLEVRDDLALPVRQGALEHVLEALGAHHGGVGVARVRVLRELRAELDLRRRDVVRAAPEHELLLAELLERLLLVLALERAVVTLVEAPRPLHGDPVAVRRVEREVRRRDGAAQERGVHDVGRDAGLGEELTAALRLLGPLLRQGDVHPAGEQVLGVPFALAVAE